MLGLRQLLHRLRDLARRPTLERDLDDEMRFHLEMQAAAHEARGLDPAAARAEALREFGGVVLAKESVRDARGLTVVDDLRRDIRFAARVLRRSPGFTAVAMITLALGIGATTAVFTVVNGVLLRALPFPHSARLVALFEHDGTKDRMAVSFPNFTDWRAESRAFAGMAAYGAGEATVLGASEPVRASVTAASADFFRVLRVAPLRGRTFLPEESRPGGVPVAVVSEAFWRRYLGATPTLGDVHLELWNTSFTVVGVMPSSFDFPEHSAIWIPLEPLEQGSGRTAHNDQVIARLAPGVTIERARAEMNAIAARLHERHHGDDDATAATVVGLRDEMVGPVRRQLALVFGAVLFVLLVACVNLTSANLARGAARAREMALRTALGAGRGRLVRQLVAENLLLALAGGGAGIALAVWLVRMLLALAPATLPRAGGVSVSATVLLFAVGVSVVTGLCIALLPALQVSATDLRGAIADGERGTSAGRRPVRGALIAVEVGMALVLLVGAGLLIRSFRALLAQDPGFDPRGVLTAELSLPSTRAGSQASIAAYYDQALASVASVPGVEHAALINAVPLGPSGLDGAFAIGDRPGEKGYADYRVVSEDYFATMRIPIITGRGFLPSDDSSATNVTLVNQTLARRLWPGESPIGKRIRPFGMDKHAAKWLTVVGVVGDVRQRGLDTPPRPEHYVFYRQRPERASDATIVIRTSVPPGSVAGAVRERLRAIDPDVPVVLATMDDVVARSLADRRFVMLVLTGFGALALVLAAVGIYGVLSHSVASRTREIGIRAALGADGRRVLALVMRDAMLPVLAGLAAGVGGAALLTRLTRALLYDVSPMDAPTIGAAITLIALVAVAAALVPARRAMRVDPVVALREG
ncbi:MAG TPA: ABC transporter permease [Gemmatimonadaceae bacterium]